MSIKIKSKKIDNWLKVFNDDLEKIETYNKKVENDWEHSCQLKGSYHLLEYDVEEYEVLSDFLSFYRIEGNKVIFRGGLNYPKNLVDKEMLERSFSRLEEYIEKINSHIENFKNLLKK